MSGVAVVGGGYWGRNLVRNFHELGVLRVVCDADAARLADFREQYGVATALAFADVLADAEVTAVVLATPAERHAAMAREALLADKDLFVEKPLALTKEEGEELVALARERDRILMVGHLLHYHGAVQRLKQLVAEGELGRVRYLYSNRLNLGKIRREENILWSFAPHDVSVMLALAQERPESLACQGGAWLHALVADVTVSTLTFASGLRGHIFVSWLHPYKEQKLVVVGERKMAVFDDREPEHKLLLYEHAIEWKEGMPVPHKGEAVPVDFDRTEPLREECRHFLECVEKRSQPRTDGAEGVRVLEVLGGLQRSLDAGGAPVRLAAGAEASFFAHPTAVVDDPSAIGAGSRVWHYSHVSRDCTVGPDCNIGQNVYIAPHVRIGRNVKIQNNVSVYEGVELDDDVFCGPSMVFTNVRTPRSHVSRRDRYEPTRVGRGATFGANCTVVCGNAVGAFAFVGAGAVVTKPVAEHALVAGNPARRIGWMCRCGERLPAALVCGSCGSAYREDGERLVRAGGSEA